MMNKISAIVISLILVAGTIAVSSQILRPALAQPPEGYVPLIPPEACSSNVPGTETLAICKKVEAADSDGDGIIEVGELITFTMTVTVTNPSANTWTNVVVKDNFGAELDVIEPCILSDVTDTVVFTQTNNKSAKEKMTWTIGTLGPGETASLTCTIETDLNPAGHQEYTECSLHEFNSGATLKFLVDGKQVSFGTGGITASVLTENAEGDCDGDGFSDAAELAAGSDPHTFDPCEAAVFDICVDGDGIASADRGLGAFTTTGGSSLTTWPSSGFGPEGIDLFDNDVNDAYTDSTDDIMLENPAGACSTALRDADFDDNLVVNPDGTTTGNDDCPVLDLDGSLLDGQIVSCDLETGTFCTAGMLADLASIGIKYADANTSTFYDNGEDIIQDTNGNGIFD